MMAFTRLRGAVGLLLDARKWSIADGFGTRTR
jgi:hypothetical protein